MKDWLSLCLLIVAIAFLAFLYGAAVGIYRIYPYNYLSEPFAALTEVISRRQEGTSVTVNYLYKSRYPGSGVTIYDNDRAQPGVTLLTSHWPRNGRLGAGARLIDMDGNKLHEWAIDPDKIWEESPHSDFAGGKYNQPQNFIHGSYLFPNGDLIVNVEYLGLVRYNACSEIVWKLPYRTHHSVDRDDDGNFWVAGLNWRETRVDTYVHLKPPFVDETVLKVSPDGEILDEIFVLESLYNSGYQGVLADIIPKYDVTHVNDVEVLGADMADSFTMFEAGDIMVSLRNLSLVIVIDGVSHAVKWHFRHPLIHQHDPDFESDGHIVIFDNQDDTTRDGSGYGRSRLLRVNPATDDYEVVYPVNDDQPLYTQEGGKHQLLDNGNRLITEANPGRVVEVSPEGETVWNWIIGQDADGLVPEVLEGTRYPAEYAKFAGADCSAP
jgi:hypothetical protein